MNELPIRKLTLYKQGIGYFGRAGEVKGSTVSLVVPLEGINDVLKSLDVTIQSAGQLLGVDYETPEDKQKVLDELGVKLADRSSLVDLFSSLRGSRAALTLHDGQQVSGRLVGVESSLDPNQHPAQVVLQDETTPSELHVLPIGELAGISLLESRAITDVGFFLDVNQTEQTRTTLTIRLSDEQHKLNVNYLAPGPTWRVGYRLISTGANTARLVGWGLFENHLDEDLDQVQLTLVSGRPISFEYALYESYVPSRPRVSDDPLALDAVSSDPFVAESISTISHEIRTPLSTIGGYADLLANDSGLTDQQKEMVRRIRQSVERMNDMLGNLLGMSRLQEDTGRAYRGQGREWGYTAGPLGDLKVSSAYFKPVTAGNAGDQLLIYEVETPVSVRRGQSAMVPIIDCPVQYEELCVYNGDKMPNHPLRVWQLANNTGQTLEQGPVTVVSKGEYLGDGLIRFTGVDDTVQIPYALEFGILVSDQTEWSDLALLSVTFDAKERKAVVSRYRIMKQIYTLSSQLAVETAVYIERRDPRQGDYYEMPEPALAQAGHTRWQVAVPAQGETGFTVKVRDVHRSREDVATWDKEFVTILETANLLPAAVGKQVKQLVEEREQMAGHANELKSLESEYARIGSRQEQLRQNLGALGSSQQETKIRGQVLDDLEASENRRRELEQLMTGLNTTIKALQERQQTLLDEIYTTPA